MNPRDPMLAARYRRAATCLKEKRYREAEGVLRGLVEADAEWAEAAHLLGIALAAQGERDEARPLLERAFRARPQDKNACGILARCLEELGDWDEAERVLRAGGAAVADSLPGLLWRAARARMAKAQFAEAAATWGKFVALKPQDPRGWGGYGFSLQECGDFAGAGQAWRRAADLGAGASAGPRHAHMLALQGRLEEFWPLYEERFDPANKAKDAVKLPELPMPMWRGEPLSGKRVLLWSEQGLGDTLQFSRYARLLKDAGASVTLAASAPLTRVLATLPWVSGVRRMKDAAAPGEFDFWAFPLSLPHRFGTTLDTIPDEVPYLSAEPEKRAAWRERLSPHAGRRKVGLAWGGNPRHLNDANRSIALKEFAPLKAAGCAFFSLQKGPHAAQLADAPLQIADLAPQLADLSDTAALLCELDLLISVDSAPAHLAGALGTPVWTLLPAVPDWRWLAQRRDSPWYPTMRLYRQPARGQWQPVLEEVAGALKAFASR